MHNYWIANFDSVAFSLGPLDIRWYSIAYMVGFLVGYQFCIYLSRYQPRSRAITSKQLESFLLWAVLAVILGGRLGYVLFYYPIFYLQNPLEIIKIWQGGMSFHGGALGVVLAMFWFAKRHHIDFLSLSDLIVCAVPIGLGLGRLANFINGELWGKPSDVKWAVIFPRAGPEPRHPSQLYEAGLEGLVLLVLLWFLAVKLKAFYKAGYLSGVFLLGYSVFRSLSEIWREPEILVDQLPFATSWGQWLSLPMLIVGVGLIWYAHRFSKPKGP
ncbi:MAG: prolipoprotein diacylglyceryl transferase [Pseudomonadota bacterium]